MSNIYDENPNQARIDSSPESLDLDSGGFEPTSPAPQFIDPFAADTGYAPAAPAAPADSFAQPLVNNPYGQPMAEPYGGPPQAFPQAQSYPPQPAQPAPTQFADPNSGYSVYDPSQYPGQQPFPAPPQYQGQQAYAMQPYMGNPQQMGQPVPGTSIQTAFGTFFVGNKSKLAAGLLGIFLGLLGVGRFYRGHIGLGIAQILVTFFTCGAGALWGFIEGILVLVAQPGSPSSLDSNGHVMI